MAWSLTNEDVRTVKLTNGDVTEIMYKDHVKVVTYDQQAICIEYSSDYNAPIFYANRSFKLYAYCLDWTECIAPGGATIQDVIDNLNALLATSSTITIAKNGTTVGAEPAINLIEGSNITLTVADNILTNSIDVTIDASGGGGGLPPDGTYGDVVVSGAGSVWTVTDDTSNQQVAVYEDTFLRGTRPSLNFYDDGGPVSITVTDDSVHNRVDIEITSTGIGTVTSVTGSSPISSTGGTTPDISIAQADSGHDGYLSSTDWNTFNGKVDSVTATGLLTSSGGTTPDISSQVNKTKLVGRGSASAGIMEEITVGSGLTLSGTTLSANGVTGAALTKTDDTNVTLTLTGTPASALLQAVNVAVGWSGTLADSRIASASTWNSKVSSVAATSPITSSGGTTPTISTSMATNKLIGRTTAGTGVMEEISVGSGLTLSGGSLSASVSNSITHATASGTDTYTATITGVTSYADGDCYLIRFTNGNTTGATININSLGAVTLYRNNDGALIGGDIVDGAEMLLIYNSTLGGFQCIGVAPNTLLAYVTNAETITITKGQPVYVSGGVGDRIKVKLAYNTSDATSAQTIGIVLSTSIATNQKGLVIVQGQLDGLSLFPTSTWADGDYIYLGATAGTITNVKPHAPNHLVYLGYVTTASNGAAGRWYVKVQNGYEMDELHNVSAQTPSNNDGLFYNTTTSLWESKSIPTALGYTPVTNARTISTTSPLTGGGDLSANRTLAINQATTSADGYLSSTDWNTFNGKQAALVSGTNIKTINSSSILGSGNLAVGTVTSVTGTAPVVSSGGTTPAISMAAAATGTDGYLTSTDWNTFNGRIISPWTYRKTGRWWTPSNNALSIGSLTNAANSIKYQAVIIDRDITITQLGIAVVTIAGAGQTCRIGIYSNDSTNTLPLTRLVDSGTLALDSTGTKTVTGLSVSLTKGLYWFAYFSNASTGTIASVANLNMPDVIGVGASLQLGVITGYSQALAYTSLPASAGTLTNALSQASSYCTFYYY